MSLLSNAGIVFRIASQLSAMVCMLSGLGLLYSVSATNPAVAAAVAASCFLAGAMFLVLSAIGLVLIDIAQTLRCPPIADPRKRHSVHDAQLID